jgi:hypothetical protein
MPRYSRFGGSSNEEFYVLIKKALNEIKRYTMFAVVFIGDQNDLKKYKQAVDQDGDNTAEVTIVLDPDENFIKLTRAEGGNISIPIGEYKNNDDVIKTVQEIIQNKQIIRFINAEDGTDITEEYINTQNKPNTNTYYTGPTLLFGKRRSSKGKVNTVNADIAYLQSI